MSSDTSIESRPTPKSRTRCRGRGRGCGKGSSSVLRECATLLCSKTLYARGKCRSCYESYMRVEAGTLVCTKPKCKRKRTRRTLCRLHYNKFSRKLKNLNGFQPQALPVLRECSAESCEYFCAVGRNYCVIHDSAYSCGVSKRTSPISEIQTTAGATLAMLKNVGQEHPPDHTYTPIILCLSD